MSDRYPPFSGDVRCPKCGGSMDTEHYSAGTVYMGQFGNEHRWRTGDGPEWLLRQCIGCGHGWAEAPADVYPSTALRDKH